MGKTSLSMQVKHAYYCFGSDIHMRKGLTNYERPVAYSTRASTPAAHHGCI
jgi:hypothetical protein